MIQENAAPRPPLVDTARLTHLRLSVVLVPRVPLNPIEQPALGHRQAVSLRLPALNCAAALMKAIKPAWLTPAFTAQKDEWLAELRRYLPGTAADAATGGKRRAAAAKSGRCDS